MTRPPDCFFPGSSPAGEISWSSLTSKTCGCRGDVGDLACFSVMDTRRGNGNAGVGGRGGRDSRMPRSTASCWLNFKSRMARNHVWNSIQWISGAWSTEGAGVGMGGGISRLLRKACRKVGLYALLSGKQYQFLHATQKGVSVRAV